MWTAALLAATRTECDVMYDIIPRLQMRLIFVLIVILLAGCADNPEPKPVRDLGPTRVPTATSPAVQQAGPLKITLYCPDCAAEGISIYLRSRIGGTVVAQFPHGATGEIVDRKTVDGKLYYKVHVGSSTGWIAATLVTH